MPFRKKDDNTEEELRSIEGRLRTIEKASKSSSEEQLFFGISFSLLILFITLPISEAASFLETVFGMPSSFAISAAFGIQAFGILFSLGASLLRYYGSMCGEQKCKEMRFNSISSLLMGFEFFMFIIGLSTISGMTLNTGNAVFTISMGILVLAVAFCFVSLGEKRMLDFYVSKGLIPSRSPYPVISPMFAFLCFAIVVNQAFALWMFSMGYNLVGSVLAIPLVVFFSGFSLSYFSIRFRTSHKRTRGKRTKPVQSKLPKWFKSTPSTNSING